MLDVETGAMMEVWADVYAATGKQQHLELMNRYTRHRLFEPLLRGEDILTNMHAIYPLPDRPDMVAFLDGYRTVNQERGFRFVPLYEIEDQAYTVYFPIR